MKIAIDISQIAYEGTGVARYTKNLVNAIVQYDNTNEYLFFFSSLRQRLDETLAAKIRSKHTLKIFPFPPTLLDFIWNTLHIVPVNWLVGNCDIYISSDWTQAPTNSTTKKATIVHDLVYLKYPETLHPKIIAVQKRRMEWVKKECDVIIADSQSTKQDLIDLLHIEKSRIHVIYPAVEVQKPTKEVISHIYTKYNIQSASRRTKYILSVGKLEPRKNISRLISAFQKANLKDIQLLIVGPKGWDNEMSNVKGQMSNVKFLGLVPDSDLYTLYAGAEFFIYPSLYEGFGYPIIEAMSLGCPVATSNTSSMKEIADGYGLLFDPNSEEDMIETIETLSANEQLRKKLSAKGKKRANDFTLDKFSNSFNEALRLI